MHEPALLNVRERLLRAGIAPRHVNRYVAELRDHLADLVTRERAAGHDLPAAMARAEAILGTESQLVQAMMDRGAPRSLASKAPWAVFGILPPVLLVAFTVLLARGSIPYFAPFEAATGSAIPWRIVAAGQIISFVGSYAISLVVAAACIVVAQRQRLSSRWVWAGLALLALASGPIGVHVEFMQAQYGFPGGIRGSVIQTVLERGTIDLNATLLLMAIRTCVLFALSALAFLLLRQRATNGFG